MGLCLYIHWRLVMQSSFNNLNILMVPHEDVTSVKDVGHLPSYAFKVPALIFLLLCCKAYNIFCESLCLKTTVNGLYPLEKVNWDICTAPSQMSTSTSPWGTIKYKYICGLGIIKAMPHWQRNKTGPIETNPETCVKVNAHSTLRGQILLCPIKYQVQRFIDRVRLINQLAKILQVIIPFEINITNNLTSPLSTYLGTRLQFIRKTAREPPSISLGSSQHHSHKIIW